MRVRLHKHDDSKEDVDVAAVEIVNGFEVLWIAPSQYKAGFQLEVADAPAENAFASDSDEPGTAYWPEVGDDTLCVCGHPYFRHFDTYDDMAPIGCKYCPCNHFQEMLNADGSTKT